MIANSVWFKDVAGKSIRKAESKLSPEAAAQAHKRGQKSDPRQMGVKLLELVSKIAGRQLNAET